MPDKTSETGALTRNDLKPFHRDVASLLLSICNDHGIRWRMPDGRHIILYNGDRSTIPFKISAARTPEHSVDFLVKWIETNVPSYFIAKEKPAPPAEQAKPEPESEPAPLRPDKWDVSRPLVFSDNRVSDFIMRKPDGSVWCTECDFTAPDARGAHLHEKVHKPDEQAAMHAKGLEAKRAKREAAEREAAEQQLRVEQALHTVAEHFGFGLVSVQGQAQLDDYAQVAEERDRLRAEVDDLKAKIALIREAMSV